MHSALFIASLPDDDRNWHNFLDALSAKLKSPTKGVLRLAENVWLLNLQEAVGPLGWLVAIAEQGRVVYGILLLPHAPEWLPAGFDPKPILDRNG